MRYLAMVVTFVAPLLLAGCFEGQRANRDLLARQDLKAHRARKAKGALRAKGPSGERGPQGKQGPQGEKGAPGRDAVVAPATKKNERQEKPGGR